MSKKIQETPETGLDGINDSLTAMTQKVQDNKKIITRARAIHQWPHTHTHTHTQVTQPPSAEINC